MPPKKTKQIAKPAKEQSEQRSNNNQDQAELFTESFRNRVDQYSNLTKEVLVTKAQVQGTNTNSEITERRERVSQRIEEAASEILKDELQSLEKWIVDQQQSLTDQIERINQAHQQIQKILKGTGSFSAAQVKSQLSDVEARSNEKKGVHASYGQLLKKSQKIYN